MWVGVGVNVGVFVGAKVAEGTGVFVSVGVGESVMVNDAVGLGVPGSSVGKAWMSSVAVAGSVGLCPTTIAVFVPATLVAIFTVVVGGSPPNKGAPVK